MSCYKKLLLFIVCLMSMSCSYVTGDNGILQNRDTDYLKAKTGKTLIVPPDLSSSTIDTHYPVSDATYPAPSKKVKLLPPELTTSELTIAPKSNSPAVADATIPIQQQIPNYYFDQYTRSSTNKAGIPIKQALQTLWPWSKKTSIETVTPAKQTMAANEVSAPRTDETQNNASKTPPEKSKMPAMYYDRFTNR